MNHNYLSPIFLQYQTDVCLEKSMDPLTINGNEISFKFPMDDDKIYTVDELILPPPTAC